MLPIPQNDTVRLIIHAVCFLTIFIGIVVMIVLDQIEPADGLVWFTAGAGLISTGLSTAKMLQDRRSSYSSGQ